MLHMLVARAATAARKHYSAPRGGSAMDGGTGRKTAGAVVGYRHPDGRSTHIHRALQVSSSAGRRINGTLLLGVL